MALETNFLKDYFGALPQKTDVDSIMAKDANGNPVWIKKADLAAVAAELMPFKTNLGTYPCRQIKATPEPHIHLIGTIPKTASMVNPSFFLIHELTAFDDVAFYSFMINNREEGIRANVCNINKAKSSLRFFYKEEGDLLSFYIYTPNVKGYVITYAYAGMATLLYEEQATTSTDGLTEILIE